MQFTHKVRIRPELAKIRSNLSRTNPVVLCKISVEVTALLIVVLFSVMVLTMNNKVSTILMLNPTRIIFSQTKISLKLTSGLETHDDVHEQPHDGDIKLLFDKNLTKFFHQF